MKGLSEMVGAALLIAVVMFAGTMVATWGPAWVSGERSSLTCVTHTNYVVEGADFNENSGRLQIKVTNFGMEPLYGFGLTLYNGTSSMQYNYSQVDQGGITEDKKLKRGESTYVSVIIPDMHFGRNIERLIVTNEMCYSVTTESRM